MLTAPSRPEPRRGILGALSARPDQLPSVASGRGRVPLLLGVVLVCSTLLRLRGLGFHYWIDEGISVGIASHPIGQLPGLLRDDGSPPLWYLLLHGWMGLFGTGPTATHLLSLLAAQLCIPAAWWALRPLSRQSATIAAILAAGVPYLTFYGEETRMYSLMALWSLLVAGSLLRALVLERRRWLIGFVLTQTAAMYTHNWGLFLAVASTVAIAVWGLSVHGAARRARLRDGALALGACLVLYLPWLGNLLFQSAHTGAPWAVGTTLWTWTQGLYFIGGGRDVAAVLLLGGVGGLLEILRRREATSEDSPTAADPRPTAEALSREGRALLILAILVWVSFGLGWVLGKAQPSFAMRYEAAIVGPLILLVSVALSRGRALAVLAVLLCCVWWVVDPRPGSASSKSNVAAVLAVAGDRLDAGSLVLSTQPEQVPTLHYYLPRVRDFATPVGVPASDSAVDWVGLAARLRRVSPTRELTQLLRGRSLGSTVGLVLPVGLPPHPIYLKLIDRDSERWLAQLRHDPAYREILSTRRAAASSGNPVELVVFRRVG